MKSQLINEAIQNPITIKPLVEEDILKLEQILYEHVRDSETQKPIEDEINDIKGYMRGKLDGEGRKRNYLVAKDIDGVVIGCMAWSVPDKDILKHFSTTEEESGELLNAFVTKSMFRGKGVGKHLFVAIEDSVRKTGRSQLLVHSGPRYKESWGFYDKVCDASAGFIIGKYGTNKDGSSSDAKTWIRYL